MFDLNPLDVLRSRSLSHIPPHFSKMKVSNHELGFGQIEGWVKVKLKGRYAITQMPAIDPQGHLKNATFIAFEDQKELTYFMLACPHLRRN